MGRAWADNLSRRSDVELVAWVDVREGAAAEAAQSKGIHVGYAGVDLVAGIDQAGPDFVVDVTSPNAHHDVTLLSLSRGIPVIGEKPMAETMYQAKAMVRASEESGKLYMVSQSRRYDAGLVAFKAAIQQKLGRLGILNADFYIDAHFGGFRAEMPSPLLLDMAIHTFDEARFLSGRNAVAVYAEEFNPGWSWFQGDACASVIFEMEGGLRFTYRGSWCAEGFQTSWDGDWRAVGENGSASWALNGDPVTEIATSREGFRSEVSFETHAKPELEAGIAGSLAEFLNALRTGSKPWGECHDNIQSLAMVFAAIESSRRRERVTIDEILAG
jgi:predicted dehydrogenase